MGTLGWFVGSVALSALSLAFDSNPPLSVMVEGTHVKLGHEQAIVAEMIPDELQVFVVNMTEGAEIPEDMTVAFYSCLRPLSTPSHGHLWCRHSEQGRVLS